MVRHLRAGQADTGLLYGQGEFVTKHHAVVVARKPPRLPTKANYSVQAEVDRRRGLVPPLLTDYRGEASIETHSAVYDRDGAILHGVVIARTPDGARIMARVAARDVDLLRRLTDHATTPIGLRVSVARGDDRLLYCS